MATDISIMTDVRNTYEYEQTQQVDLRQSSEDNYNYMRGDGWVKYRDEETRLKADGKPTLNLNLILPRITLILGYNVQNRYDLKAYPAGMGTSDFLAMICTKLIKHISNESGLRFEMSEVVLDALVANIGGYASIDWTNEKDPMGEFLIRRESPFYHMRDSNNEKYDINNGQYHIRYKWLNQADLLSSYPDRKEEILRFTQKAKEVRKSTFFANSWAMLTKKKEPIQLDYINQKDGQYKVVELWEKKIEEKKAIYNLETQDMFQLPEGQEELYKRAINKMESRKFEIVTVKPKRIFVKTVLADAEVLVNNKEYDVKNGLFPFMPAYTYWIDGQPMSNVENMKDYQDEHNKRSSQILHILNSTANSGWWVKQMGDNEDSIDIDNLIANNTKMGFVGKYKGNTPPVKIDPNKFPSGHQYMDEQAKQGINDTSGIGQNMEGKQESSGESGILFSKRVKQGEVMLSMFFDNMRRSKEILGKYLVSAIPKMYTGERIYRIVLDDDNQEVLMLNTDSISDITKGQFKIVLDEVDRSPTAKTQEFMELMAFVGSGIPPELIDWAEIIRSSTFPSKEELAQYAEQVLMMTMGIPPDSGTASIPQALGQTLANEQMVNSA